MRVEVVAEEDPLGLAVGLEQARTPVVDEIRLIDRLEPELEARGCKGREDGLPLGHVAKRRGPERTLAACFLRNRFSRRGAHGPPRPSPRSPRRRARATGRGIRTGWARD